MSLVWGPKGISFGYSPQLDGKQPGLITGLFENPGDCHTGVRTGSQ